MRSGAWSAAVLLVLAAVPARADPGSVLEALDRDVRALCERVAPAVVRVEAEDRRTIRIEGGVRVPILPSYTRSRVGSGFVVGEHRLILTSRSVVVGAQTVRVVFRDGASRPARVRGTDAFFRVALLEAEVPEAIRPLRLAASSAAPGSVALLHGNAHGSGSSAVLGLVCAGRRKLLGFDEFLVVSVPLTPGDSGAPVVNVSGEVVGMGSAALSDVEMRGARIGLVAPNSLPLAGRFACCVPASDLRRVLDDLAETGHVRQAWLGVTLTGDGPEVDVVVAGSPAERAGLRRGDRILAVAGREVESRTDVAGALARLRPDQAVTIRLRRDGEEIDLPVTVVERAVRESGDLIAVRDGVQILRVVAGSGAARLGLLAGDVIARIDGSPADDVEAAREVLARAKERGAALDLVIFRRGREIHFEIR